MSPTGGKNPRGGGAEEPEVGPTTPSGVSMAEPVGHRPGDQPLPVINDQPSIQSLVRADLDKREQVGIERYGTSLQPHNGRDALRDLYEELLDGACYARQLMVEQAGLVLDLAAADADEARVRIRQGLHARYLDHADTCPAAQCIACAETAHIAATEVVPLLAAKDAEIREANAKAAEYCRLYQSTTDELQVIRAELRIEESNEGERDSARAEVVALGKQLERLPASLVREFHETFDLPIGDTSRTTNVLRAELIREEAREAAEAIESGDPLRIAKELADLVYVAYGGALTLSVDLDRAVALVHESNMSKLVDGCPVMRPDGKVLKGPNYRVPDMSAALLPSRRERDARTLAGLLGFTAGVSVTPDEADEWLNRDPGVPSGGGTDA